MPEPPEAVKSCLRERWADSGRSIESRQVAATSRLVDIQLRNSGEGTLFGSINFVSYLLERPG